MILILLWGEIELIITSIHKISDTIFFKHQSTTYGGGASYQESCHIHLS